jgi:hypothetical protein
LKLAHALFVFENLKMEDAMSGKRFICFFIALFCLASMAVSVSAQESFNVSCIRQFESNWHAPVSDVAVQGDFIFAACLTDGLRIVNVSNPDHYQDFSQLHVGEATAVVIDGQFAYLATNDSGLVVVDISEKSQPSIVSSLPIAGTKYNIRKFGEYVFICTDRGLPVVDVSNPQTPLVISNLTTLENADITVSDNKAYIACGYDGLAIYDISDIGSPQLLDRYHPEGNYLTGVSLYQNYAVLAAAWCGIEMLDLATMQVVASIDTLRSARWVKVQGDYAYLAYGYPECPLAIINISNPTSLVLSSIYYPPEDIANFAVSGDIVFVADFYHGIRGVDITDRCNPIERVNYNRFGFETQVKNNGNRVFERTNYKLTALDLAVPAEPQELGFFETNWEFVDFAMEGDTAYILGEEPSVLYSVDFSNPTRPVLLQQFTPPGDPTYNKIGIHQNYLYLIGWSNLQIIDISNPGEMQLAGDIPMFASPTFLYMHDDYAIYQSTDDYFGILDISDPLHPVNIGSYFSDSYCFDMKIEGNLLYAGIYDHVKIFNIDDLSNWILVGDINAQGEEVSLPNRFEIVGNRLYITVQYTGLYVYDISDPSQPRKVGFSACPGRSYDVADMGDIAIVADFTGLGIYDCSEAQGINDGSLSNLPVNLALLPNYPNPFNSSTIISIEIGERSNIAIDVVDLLGREVAVLSNTQYEAGIHVIRWDGSGKDGRTVSSGQYYIRANSGSESRTMPVTLLK